MEIPLKLQTELESLYKKCKLKTEMESLLEIKAENGTGNISQITTANGTTIKEM